jgi:hypothetical protein
MILAYHEFVDFLAGDTTPQGVIDYRPSEKKAGDTGVICDLVWLALFPA